MRPVRIGLVDSGVSVTSHSRIVKTQCFRWMSKMDKVIAGSADKPLLVHGQVLAEMILGRAPEADLFSAQIFHDKLLARSAQVAAAIDWLVDESVQVINMSFGLHRDDPVLRSACQRALNCGVILVAASPARGRKVYPSAYEGVFSVTGDARCGENLFSYLNKPRVDFGACVSSAHPAVSGSSVATARLTGIIGGYLLRGGRSEPALLRSALRAMATIF